VRMSQEQYDAHQRKFGKPSARKPSSKGEVKAKYRATRTEVGTEKFDSSLEARYFLQLTMEWRSVRARLFKPGETLRTGDLLWFKRQERFELEGGVVYMADYVVVRYFERGPHTHLPNNYMELVDTKGILLQASKNKMKQVKDRYNIDVIVLRDEDVMKVSV